MRSSSRSRTVGDRSCVATAGRRPRSPQPPDALALEHRRSRARRRRRSTARAGDAAAHRGQRRIPCPRTLFGTARARSSSTAGRRPGVQLGQEYFIRRG